MHRCVHIHSIDSLENPTIDCSVHTFFPLKINLLNLIDVNYYMFYLPLFFFKIIFLIYSWETHREMERHKQGEKEAPQGEPGVDFVLGLQITREPKADTQPLNHPGVPLYVMSNLTELPFDVLLWKIVFCIITKIKRESQMPNSRWSLLCACMHICVFN